MLLYLVRNPGRVVSKEELLKNVWEDAFVDENNLAQSISSLRRALNERAGTISLIATVPGRGYQFVLPVETRSLAARLHGDSFADSRAQSVLVQQHTVTTSVVTLERRWMPLRVLLVGGILLVAVLCATGYFWMRTQRVVAGDHHEVVLSDFENMTGEADFSEPLKTAMTIDLRQSPYLSVATDARVADTLKMMEQPAKNPLTPALAREVCQRLNDQTVLSAMIARFGSKYLVTLTASDCATGNTLIESRSTAETRDGILQAVDTVAANTRKRLGEPSTSVKLYSQPVVLSKETGSLDALKAYTVAHDLGAAGKFQAAIPLFQRAIELDPKFAAAYADLAAVYTNLSESALATANFTKAYQLRDFTDEKDRLYIVAAYSQRVTGDLNATIRDLETWTELYPDATSAWANMGSGYLESGQYDRARDAAQHAVALDENAPFGYIVLATAQLGLGQVVEAKATCRSAIARKIDIVQLRSLLFSAGALENDEAAMAEQVAWAKANGAEPAMQLQQWLYAVAVGRARESTQLMNALVDGYKKQGQQERAIRLSGIVPRGLVYLGEIAEARTALKALPTIDSSTDIPVAAAEVGEVAVAESLLEHEMHKHPDDTLWQTFRGPQIRAAIAMAKQRPELAIEALRPAASFEARNSEVPALRGEAYLALHQPAQAIAEFQKTIAHPGIDPLSPNHALAHLGEARALVMEKEPAAGRKEYEKFFAMWDRADEDVPVLQAARAEYGKLH